MGVQRIPITIFTSIAKVIKGRVIYYQVGGRLYSGGVGFFFFGDVLWGGENKNPLGQGGSYISSGIWGGQMCSIGFCFH